MKSQIHLRPLTEADPARISQAFSLQGGDKPESLYHRYLKLQKSKKLEPIMAEVNGDFAGYLAIKWTPDYPPFRENGIPEVVDFNLPLHLRLRPFHRSNCGSLPTV